VANLNGLHFNDDLHGVADPGPVLWDSVYLGFTYSWHTSAGGVTWVRGGRIPESWSSWGIRNTAIYFAASEGSKPLVARSVMKTEDQGVTWKAIYTFPSDIAFT